MNVIELLENIGCSDGNCELRDNRQGMHTNGGCLCRRNGQIKILRNMLPEIIAVLKDVGKLVEFYKAEGTEHGFEDNLVSAFEALNKKADGQE
jgi:hypothetical protein